MVTLAKYLAGTDSNKIYCRMSIDGTDADTWNQDIGYGPKQNANEWRRIHVDKHAGRDNVVNDKVDHAVAGNGNPHDLQQLEDGRDDNGLGRRAALERALVGPVQDNRKGGLGDARHVSKSKINSTAVKCKQDEQADHRQQKIASCTCIMSDTTKVERKYHVGGDSAKRAVLRTSAVTDASRPAMKRRGMAATEEAAENDEASRDGACGAGIASGGVGVGSVDAVEESATASAERSADAASWCMARAADSWESSAVGGADADAATTASAARAAAAASLCFIMCRCSAPSAAMQDLGRHANSSGRRSRARRRRRRRQPEPDGRNSGVKLII